MTKKFNVFDIETVYHEKKRKFIPICICLLFKGENHTFIRGEKNNITFEMITKIFQMTNNNKTSIIYAHNLTFDGSLILDEISNNTRWGEITMDGLFLNGNIYLFNLKLNNKTIIFKCSFRLFASSLASAHKKLDTEKKLEFDHNKINIKNYKKFIDEIVIYCKHDVIITNQILIKYYKFFNRYDKNILNKLHTISGISYNIFLKHFNEHKIQTSLEKSIDEFFRKGYSGGRCDVFGNPIKGEYIYHFDFKGMYAQIMHDDFGCGKMIISDKMDINEIKPHGMYKIKFHSKLIIPLLPQKSESGKLIFKNGSGNGIYYGEILLVFLKLGGEILEMNECIYYNEKEKVFKSFASHFLLRRDENNVSNTIGKITTNSLYGRLGMNIKDVKTSLITEEGYFGFIKKNFNNIISEQKINDIYIIKTKVEDDKEFLTSNVLYAAAITSKAQIKLYMGFLNTVNNGGRLLYCDTDSIFAAFNNKIDGETHGEIVWDEKTYKPRIIDAVFALPKAYALKYEDGSEVIKIKGIKINNITFADFKYAFYNNKILEENLKTFTKSNYQLKIEEILKKTDLSKYDKRIWSSCKKYTTNIED